MKRRFRLVQRRRRGGTFYCFDTLTCKRVSLQTKDRDEAEQIVQARNQALRQPALNLQIAKAYLAGSDPAISSRTWQSAMDEITKTKQGETRVRYETAMQQSALDGIRSVPIMETRAEHFLKALEMGTVSTNAYLRRLQNFALDMSWLPWPIIPKRQWPPVRFKDKRAITMEEHHRIVQRELNDESRSASHPDPYTHPNYDNSDSLERPNHIPLRASVRQFSRCSCFDSCELPRNGRNRRTGPRWTNTPPGL